MGELSILDREHGDYKVTWDPNNRDETDVARRNFEDFVDKKRYAAFKVNAAGEKEGTERKFDPNARAYIFAPPQRGG